MYGPIVTELVSDFLLILHEQDDWQRNISHQIIKREVGTHRDLAVVITMSCSADWMEHKYPAGIMAITLSVSEISQFVDSKEMGTAGPYYNWTKLTLTPDEYQMLAHGMCPTCYQAMVDYDTINERGC